jgi:hypothetical protein
MVLLLRLDFSSFSFYNTISFLLSSNYVGYYNVAAETINEDLVDLGLLQCIK